MNSLFKNRFMVAYYTEKDDQYLDNSFHRTKKEACEDARFHIADQFQRFGLRLIAKVYNVLRYKPDDKGVIIGLIN